MNFKFNWGHGIFLSLAFFVLFIGSFVYKTLFLEEYDHALVSKEYYKEEIKYQEEIDRLNNANKLETNLVTIINSKGISLKFPDDFDYNKIHAHIKLQRLNDVNFDIEKEIVLDSLIYLIPKKHLINGRYSLKINWEYDEIPYQFKEKIDF